MPKKILVVLTNTAKWPQRNRATGLWLGEAVHFVQPLVEAGLTVDYASPAGGYVPVDPKSLTGADETTWHWYQDKAFMDRLGNTLKPTELKPLDYAAIYYAGGHGTLWDFPENPGLQQVTQQIHEGNGLVCAVCHGVVGLLNVKLSNNALLLRDRQVTGFSNIEEKLAEYDRDVPYLTETELCARGALYSCADDPWKPHVVMDERARLITGQNPASAGPVAHALLHTMGLSKVPAFSYASGGR